MRLYSPAHDYAKIHVVGDHDYRPLCRPARALKRGAGASLWNESDLLKLTDRGYVCALCARRLRQREAI